MKKINTKSVMKDKNSFVPIEREREGMQMNRAKLCKQRHRKLGNGKAKKIGFIESIGLKLIGYYDGRKGLPRQMDEKKWCSPFMNYEANSYKEFCSHIWGSLQIENEGEYARLEELMDRIHQKKRLLDVARSELAIAYKREIEFEPRRNKGEDKLTDAQIYTRRKAERDKKLAQMRNKVAELEQKLKEAEDIFSDLHCKLVEADNTTRLICHRVRDHILMCMDVYWNSVLRHHPDGASMPGLYQCENSRMRRRKCIFDRIRN